MDSRVSLGEDDIWQRHLRGLELDNQYASSSQSDSTSRKLTTPFFGDRTLEKGTSIENEFDPSRPSQTSPLQANTISWQWPYNGLRISERFEGITSYENSSAGPSPSSKCTQEQYSIPEICPEISLFNEISSRLGAKYSHQDLPSVEDASWLQTTIRSLFDSTSHHSSSLEELNARHPDVHFEGSSFMGSTHETLSSVLVSSGINAHIIFLKDIERNSQLPVDSSRMRNWIIENAGNTLPLVLLEFLLHCECGILRREHKRKAIRLLQKIAIEHHILPPTLELLGVEPDKHPFTGGGYSDVYRGSWNGVTVCIKRLRVYLDPERSNVEAQQMKVLQAFLKEAIIWKQLRHPNILPFMGVSSTCFPNQMSLISPYMKNGDIMKYLESKSQEDKPTYGKRLAWLLGAAKGMQFIHSMHLYHGDIKGANILLDYNGQARLADLGISSVAASASETLGWETATTNVKGSLRWMAPEVILDSEPSRTTARDIYAFGSTILEVVTGRFPWSNIREDSKVILHLCQGKHPNRPDGFGNDVWSIIESCWTADPVLRPSAMTILERCRLSCSVVKRIPKVPTSSDSSDEESSWDTETPASSVVQSEASIHKTKFVDDRVQFRPLETFTLRGDKLDPVDWLETNPDDANCFVNRTLLSHLAVRLKDRVLMQTHVKGYIPYPKTFTGMDIISTLQDLIQQELETTHPRFFLDQAIVVEAARSLQSQFFFNEVECTGGVLQDEINDIFVFPYGGDFGIDGLGGLPNGVLTPLTKCYSPTCAADNPCYSGVCPRRVDSRKKCQQKARVDFESPNIHLQVRRNPESAAADRRSIILKLISREQAYLHDLDLIESAFLEPLIHACQSGPSLDQYSQLSVLPSSQLSEFIDTIFSNILDLRTYNRHLLESILMRQRQQNSVDMMGDIFLGSARELRTAYVEYLGNLGRARDVLGQELQKNGRLNSFLEGCARSVSSRSRQSSKPSSSTSTASRLPGEAVRTDILYFLCRPLEHLSQYPSMLQAVLALTPEGAPDEEYLPEAIAAFKAIEEVARLRQWQRGYPKKRTKEGGGSGPMVHRERRGEIRSWVDFLDKDSNLMGVSDSEKKRQSAMFEMIQSEMDYVADLQCIEKIYIEPLRNADTPIIDPNLLESFIHDVFLNYHEILDHHTRLLDKLHRIQRDDHPFIKCIMPPIMDAFLNVHNVYLKYMTNYPIATRMIEEEMRNNPMFDAFVNRCLRHPNAKWLGIHHFVRRPISRLFCYESVLKVIGDCTPFSHPDQNGISSIFHQLKVLCKSAEPGTLSVWAGVTHISNMVFKDGVGWVDMDLLNGQRTLKWKGKVLRRRDKESELNKWEELFVFLFDNYLVTTEIRRREGVEYYYLNRQPIPLELLTLVNFSDNPVRQVQNILQPGQTYSSPAAPEFTDSSRLVYPCTIHSAGRDGGIFTLYTEYPENRTEWKDGLEEALGLRRVVQEGNRVFEIETLSIDTLVVPSAVNGAGLGRVVQQMNSNPSYTGRVTCSVPFTMSEKQKLVAIGCEEGVWIGSMYASHSMRQVLNVKMVKQCAILEEFGLLLVLAHKSLLAYRIEALTNSEHLLTSQVPLRLSGSKEVQFFSVGNHFGRNLIIYMEPKKTESVFHILEPLLDNIYAGLRLRRQAAPQHFQSKSNNSEWFKSEKRFSISCEAYDMSFLKNTVAVMCARGFEIVDLHDYSCITVPQTQDPKMEKIVRRCEETKSLGIFQITEDGFLLCYQDFGFYVNRHGNPLPDHDIIEWEGSATSIALHLPYIFVFSSRFVEIRRLETGRLCQIITGEDVHCLWDGRTHTTGTSTFRNSSSQSPRVHAAMNKPSSFRPGSAGQGTVAQHVFEMVPNMSLFQPDLSPILRTRGSRPRRSVRNVFE